MKKIIAMLLAIALMAAMAACGGNQQPDAEVPQDAPAAPEATPEQTPEADAPAAEAGYSFTYEGVELIPGAAFDPAALPEAESLYQVPSCAIEGTDNVYNYGVMEVTAFNDGSGEVIYSVYIIDPNTPSAEGLYLGDDVSVVDTLCGTDYTQEGTQRTYQKGDTLLIVLIENDFVASIEYRWATNG